MFDDATIPYLIDPIATLDGASGDWQFEPDATWRNGSGTEGLAGPRIVVDAIFWQYLSSGIGRVWENVLREWVKSGFIKNVIVLDRAGTAPRIPGVHYWSIPRHSYGLTGADSLLLDEVCRRLNADLFVSTYYSCTTTVPSFFAGHDMIPEMLGLPSDDETWHEKRRAILHAVGHSMVSQSSASDLEKLYPIVPRGSTFVVYNGIAPVFTRPRAEEIGAFRSKHGLSFRSYVLMVGERMGVGGYKNGSLVFRALASMPEDKAPTLVCVGGRSEIETELRELAPRLDVRRLDLDDEELRAAYAGAHALLYPSKYEGFGMPPAEAMACGTPAIVCRNSSLPEVVGDAALFVDENDPGDIVRAIETLLDPAIRDDLISRGFEQVRPLCFASTAQKLAEALMETYGRLGSQGVNRSGAAWTEMRQLLAAQQQVQADQSQLREDITNAFPVSNEIDSTLNVDRDVLHQVKTTLSRWKDSLRQRNRKRLQWQRRILGKR
jgi:glycosyltransferase involved in cell wall biosynthesis